MRASKARVLSMARMPRRHKSTFTGGAQGPTACPVSSSTRISVRRGHWSAPAAHRLAGAVRHRQQKWGGRKSRCHGLAARWAQAHADEVVRAVALALILARSCPASDSGGSARRVAGSLREPDKALMPAGLPTASLAPRSITDFERAVVGRRAVASPVIVTWPCGLRAYLSLIGRFHLSWPTNSSQLSAPSLFLS